MRELPLFPLHVVVFPGLPLPLHIFEPRYQLMLRDCLAADRTFGVLLIKAGREVGEPATPYEVGTTVRIVDVSEVAPNRYNIVTVGEHRFRLYDIQRREPYLTGDVELWPDELGDEASCRVLVAELTTAYQDYAALLRALTARSIGEVQLPEDALTLSYAVASGLLVDLTDQQALLESPSVRERLEHELTLLQRERALLRLYGTVGHMRPSDVDRFSLS